MQKELKDPKVGGLFEGKFSDKKKGEEVQGFLFLLQVRQSNPKSLDSDVVIKSPTRAAFPRRPR